MKARAKYGGLGLVMVVLAALAWPGCGSLDERPATFSYLYEVIIAPNCATVGCHNAVTQTFGLQFQTKEAAYVGLTGRACNDAEDLPGQAAGNYVRPGVPDRSRLISLLVGEEVTRRMPPDRGLSSVDIALIDQWILEGAQCN